MLGKEKRSTNSKEPIEVTDLPLLLQEWTKELQEVGFKLANSSYDKQWGCYYLDFEDFYVYLALKNNNLIIKNVFTVNKRDEQGNSNHYFLNAFVLQLLPLLRKNKINKVIADNVSPKAVTFWKDKLGFRTSLENRLDMELEVR